LKKFGKFLESLEIFECNLETTG